MQTAFHSRRDISSSLDLALSQYRHEVFVNRLGWALPEAEAGLERDQFDREDTVYVVAQANSGEICGCARLLPTTQPYLLNEIFPELLGSFAAPKSPTVWELSRFSIDMDAEGGWQVGRLLAAVVECALKLGATQLIGVTFLSMERLFRRLGVHAHRVASPRCVDGKMIVACWIDLDAQTMKALNLDVDTHRLGAII